MTVAVADILKHVKGSKGIYKIIAARAGCTRKTVESKVKKNKELHDAVQEEKAIRDETILEKYWNLVESNDRGAIIFGMKVFLGYREKLDMKHSGKIKGEVTHEHKFDDMTMEQLQSELHRVRSKNLVPFPAEKSTGT